MKPYFGLRGKSLNYAVSIIAGVDFLLFGLVFIPAVNHICLFAALLTFEDPDMVRTPLRSLLAVLAM